MAYLHRLIFVVLAVLVSSANATFTGTPTYNYYGSSNTAGLVNNNVRSSPQDACQAYVNQTSFAYNPRQVNSAGVGTNACVFQLNAAIYYATIVAQATGSYSCPANATASGNNCTCNTGFVEGGTTPQSCVSAAQALCTLKSGQTTFASGPGKATPGQTFCSDIGCIATYSGMVLTYTDKTTGNTVSQGDATITATTCNYTAPTPGTVTPSTTTTTNAASTTCEGGSSGVVNGITTCVKYDPALNTVAATTSSTSSSSSTTNGTTTGSTDTKSETTTCTGATCTTTSTNTNTPSGGGAPTTTTTTSTQSQDSFCAKNPTDPVCKKAGESTWAGSCGSAPACTGDAVACAVAAQALKTACALNPDTTTPEAQAYNTAKTASDANTNVTTNLPGNGTVNLSSANFSSVSDLPAGQGISDKTITLVGHTFTLKFSQINDSFAMLKSILLAVSYLTAFAIVFRR